MNTFGFLVGLCFIAILGIVVEGKRKYKPSKNSTGGLINSNGKKIGLWKKLLKKLGYKEKFHPDDIMAAREKLKILYHFNPSTKDEDIVKFFDKTKRCGNTDLKKKGKRLRRYSMNMAWSKKHFTYTITSYTHDMSPAKQEEIVKKAFQLWKNAVPDLTFTFQYMSSVADVTFAFVKSNHGDAQDFDGTGPIIAHAEYPENGQVHFDDDESFTDQTTSGTNLLSVAVHEIGHALGLEHSSKEKAVMNTLYKEYNVNVGDIQLDADDIDGIKALYDINYTPSSSSCQDDDRSLCQTYKYYGYCVDVYYDVMREVCPDTCGLCG